MKIAYVSLNLFPTHYAHTIQIMNMCDAFMNEGYDVQLYARKSDKYTTDEELLLEYGVKNKIKITWVETRYNPKLFICDVLELLVKIKNQHDVFYNRNYFIALACRLLKLKAIYEVHKPSGSIKERIVNTLIFKSKNIYKVAISKELAKILARENKIPEEQIIIAHDAAKISATTTTKIPKVIMDAFRPGIINVLYSGSFYKGRGIATVLDLARNNPDINFICIGGKNVEVATLLETTRGIPNICIFPRVNPSYIPDILKRADILLMPYSKIATVEGQGNIANFLSPIKMGEYLASGKPILCSKLPSLSEVLIDEYNSLLCDPDNSEDWDNKLKLLLSSKDLRKKIAENAYNTALDYTWDIRVKNIMKDII